MLENGWKTSTGSEINSGKKSFTDNELNETNLVRSKLHSKYLKLKSETKFATFVSSKKRKYFLNIKRIRELRPSIIHRYKYHIKFKDCLYRKTLDRDRWQQICPYFYQLILKRENIKYWTKYKCW